jgi:maltooligosyltrehalose trehalohydrolase
MTATFAHSMPFGAALHDGGVRFRLWAPGQRRTSLALTGRDHAIPMVAQPDGWFELTTTDARAGSRYHFQLEDGKKVPDPASRFQPEDVHGPSLVVDPSDCEWQHADWRGRPWHETALYELHLGAYTAEGTYDGLRRKLDHLAGLGVTAIELMPIAEFPGRRNWGYDGVLPFAPDASYGTPDQLKRLIDEIHGRGLMAFLDVVYNHFGPDGNYLGLYAPAYFDPDKHTPWGAAIDYSQRPVREMAIHNVLYWLEEYRFDGLRFDAVDRIIDQSEPHILEEIALAVRETIPPERHVHLVLENDANDAHLLERRDGRPVYYDAQWNDDIHHVYHHLLTGDSSGYYRDYVHEPLRLLARALSTGFVYQGEPSEHRDGALRGEPSGHLPPTAFVAFIQNHDQIGNRAFGERIADLAGHPAVKAMQAVLLLAPQIPLLFMGEEWGATQPFCFFTDFHDELADAVREGRRREFQKFPQFASEEARAHIPDPNDATTFATSRLDWCVPEQTEHAAWLDLVRELLRIRHATVAPRLAGAPGSAADATLLSGTALQVTWTLGDQSRLTLVANLADLASDVPPADAIGGDVLYASPLNVPDDLREGRLPPWSVLWLFNQHAP